MERDTAVSLRTRLPAASASRKSRLVTGPGHALDERQLVGALDLALDLGLADDHRVEPGGDREEVLDGVVAAQRVDRAEQLGGAQAGLAGEDPERRVLGLHRVGR